MNEPKEREDPGVEGAAIRRLAEASKRTGDEPTGDAAVVRAVRLGQQSGFDALSPLVSIILNIGETPHKEASDE